MAGKGMEIRGNMIQAEAYFMSNLTEPSNFIYGIHLNPQCIRPTLQTVQVQVLKRLLPFVRHLTSRFNTL